MSENPQPKKPQRKAQKLKLDPKKRWQDIIKDVDKKEVHVDVLKEIIVRLVDGTDLRIDIKQLINDGQDPREIEDLLNAKFQDLEQYIENVDYFIDVDSVVNTIQPETDKVLKDL